MTDADQTIVMLISEQRRSTREEISRIRRRLNEAPFSNQLLHVPRDERGLTYQNVTLAARADAGFLHLVRRVLIDEQWVYGTSFEEYVTDLREVVADPSAALVVYDSGRGPVVGIFGINNCPPARLGARPQPFIYVVCAVDRGSIITGYQTSGIHALYIPEDAIWLT